MKRLFDDVMIYENMLITYFSDSEKLIRPLMNDKFEAIINRFLEMFMNEDRQKRTNHVEIIHKLYSNPQFEHKVQFIKSLNISRSTFQRYREKYCATLKLLLEISSNKTFQKFNGASPETHIPTNESSSTIPDHFAAKV